MSAPEPDRRFGPEDRLAPDAPEFGEAWHAQVLALADTLITSGQIGASDWAAALGAQLRAHQSEGADDTEINYYVAALAALEGLLDGGAIVSAPDLGARRDIWERAYIATPHGHPVLLSAGQD
ncbi:MAG: nitrile hydratase accessory protein [Marinosulfonomonas sp.]|nr:nitrile hydratase accessory protein [Marinosulfonomonas sp.]